jgi:hypothetical protein
VAEGMRLEDWIGETVTLNILREPVTTSDPDEEIVTIIGFLQGVDPSGVIVLFDPTSDVVGELGRDLTRPRDPAPRYVFYPWRRVTLIERPEKVEE